jgi:cytidine deaminase
MTIHLSSGGQELLAAALQARSFAYAPFSRFAVGAAVQTVHNKIYAGCNVENASYGLSMCAERVAVFKAVSAGDLQIARIAIIAGAEPTPPCGACRQVLIEFSRDMEVILGTVTGAFRVTTIADLFPDPFLLSAQRPMHT